MEDNIKEAHNRNIITNDETNLLQFYFIHTVDQLIKENLPVDHEFPLETNPNIINDQKSLFIQEIIFSYLVQIIRDHQAYLEIEAIQSLNSNKYNEKDSPYDEKGIIHLSEKAFEHVRNKILLMLFIDFIDEAKGEESMCYLSSSIDSQIKILNISKYISYYMDNNNYCFNIEFMLDAFIRINYENFDENYLLPQFKFWFLFFIPFLKLKIENFSYEYYLTEEATSIEYDSDIINQNNIDNPFEEFLSKMIILQSQYISFAQHFIFLSKPINIIFTITNNNMWIEELFESIPNGKNIIETIQKQIFKTRSTGTHNLSLKIIFNHLVLNYYGKFSNYVFDKFLMNAIRFNYIIKTILINIFEFESYEYLSLVKYNQDIIDDITSKAGSLFDNLKLIFNNLVKQKLQLVGVQIKDFISYKSYEKSILSKFKDFIREVIGKRIKIIMMFTDTDDNYKSKHNLILQTISKNSFSKYFDKAFVSQNNIDTFYNDISNRNTNTNEYEIIPSLPNFFLEHNTCMYKNEKIKNNEYFDLTIFEKELKILNNKTIDLFFFRTFKVDFITNLKLGYFASLHELNTFLSKLQLQQLYSLSKVTFYIRTNKTFSYRNIGTFFNLDWPKRSLKSIKLLYEKGFLYENFDVFTLYEDYISKKYFSTKNEIVSNSILTKTQSAMTNNNLRPLISMNDTSLIASQNLIQGNHSMLMEMSYINNPKGNNKLNFSLFPLNFVLFAQIDNYVEFKMNKEVLYNIAMEIPLKKCFNKNLEKKKLKDKFQNSILISEYLNTNLNILFYYIMTQIDRKNRRINIVKKLKTKVKKGNIDRDYNIFQYIFTFFKGRRVIYNDFPNSFKVFKKFDQETSRGQYI